MCAYVGLACNAGSMELCIIRNGSLTGMQYGNETLDVAVNQFAAAVSTEIELTLNSDNEGSDWLRGSLDACKFSVWISYHTLLIYEPD